MMTTIWESRKTPGSLLGRLGGWFSTKISYSYSQRPCDTAHCYGEPLALPILLFLIRKVEGGQS